MTLMLSQMDDDFTFFRQMEDNLNYLGNRKATSTFKANVRQPQFLTKRKETSVFWQREDDLNIFGR